MLLRLEPKLVQGAIDDLRAFLVDIFEIRLL